MEITLENAWLEAEKTAFNYIARYTNTEDTKACFLGMFPLGVVNAVMFTSGGNSGSTDIEVKRAADDNCWKVIATAARIEILSTSREKALRWAGLICKMLNDTNNMHEIGNIMWFRAEALPGEPEAVELFDREQRPKGTGWRIEFPLELIYRTDAEYSEPV